MTDAFPQVEPRHLSELQLEVSDFNTSHGWKDVPRSFGDDIALLHSELSEALDAYRSWGVDDQTRDQCTKGRDVPVTDDEISIEAGVVIIGADHDGHLCKPEGVGSELADVLVRLLDTCDRYNIDLEAEFNRKMAYNRTRSYRHGGKRV